MQYEVNISIDNEGLKKIYDAYKSVTLVKNMSMTEGFLFDLPIAWLVFQPLRENLVSWPGSYYLYVTSTGLRSGATISIGALTDSEAQLGFLYTFAQGHFSKTGGGLANAYNVSNQMQSGSFGFGLAQRAMVNNVQALAPLSAIPLLYNEQAGFTPQETVSVFLSSYSHNGTIITQVAGNALTVTLSGQQAAINIGFDNNANTFYLL